MRGAVRGTARAAGPASVASGRRASMLLAAALAGCGGGDRIAAPDGADGATRPGAGRAGIATGPVPDAPGLFADAVPTDAASSDALGVRVRLSGASADLDEIDLALDWRVAESALGSVGPDTLLEAVQVGAVGERRPLARTRVPTEAPSGRLDLTLAVPVTGTLELELRGLIGGGATTARVAVDLPAVVTPPPTPLGTLESLEVSLVPGSVSSSLRGGRRVHRFSVRVDATPGPDGGPVAVTGLEADVDAHFGMWENGHEDPESPVRARWRGEPVAVYLVLDVSSSIVLAEAADALVNAVSRTLAALAPVATFDYRTVASRVRRLTDLRALAFDAPDAPSGTAFHHALDTALDDMETRAESHAVIVGFTDGRDFASRNFYPSLGSDAEVAARIAARLARVRSERAARGELLEAHFASLGSDVDAVVLDALAEAGGGVHVESVDAGALDTAFATLSDGLRGRYRLEYSSQRRAADTDLELEVRAGALSARVALPRSSPR